MKTALESFRKMIFSKIIATVTRDQPFEHWLRHPLEKKSESDMSLLRESWGTALARLAALPPQPKRPRGKGKGSTGGWRKRRKKNNHHKRGKTSQQKQVEKEEGPPPDPIKK